MQQFDTPMSNTCDVAAGGHWSFTSVAVSKPERDFEFDNGPS